MAKPGPAQNLDLAAGLGRNKRTRYLHRDIEHASNSIFKIFITTFSGAINGATCPIDDDAILIRDVLLPHWRGQIRPSRLYACRPILSFKCHWVICLANLYKIKIDIQRGGQAQNVITITLNVIQPCNLVEICICRLIYSDHFQILGHLKLYMCRPSSWFLKWLFLLS